MIASVVGSTAVGALTQYLDGPDRDNPGQTLKTLLKENRPAALRIFEKATFKCLPELDELQSTKARKFLPRMIGVTIDMAENNGGAPSESDKAAIDKEIRQLVKSISDADAMVMVMAVNRLNSEKTKVKKCLTETFAGEARKIQAQQTEAEKTGAGGDKPLLSDVKLRGS